MTKFSCMQFFMPDVKEKPLKNIIICRGLIPVGYRIPDLFFFSLSTVLGPFIALGAKTDDQQCRRKRCFFPDIAFHLYVIIQAYLSYLTVINTEDEHKIEMFQT